MVAEQVCVSAPAATGHAGFMAFKPCGTCCLGLTAARGIARASVVEMSLGTSTTDALVRVVSTINYKCRDAYRGMIFTVEGRSNGVPLCLNDSAESGRQMRILC